MFGWIALEYLFQVLLFVNVNQHASLDRCGQVTVHDLLGLEILISIRHNNRQAKGAQVMQCLDNVRIKILKERIGIENGVGLLVGRFIEGRRRYFRTQPLQGKRDVDYALLMAHLLIHFPEALSQLVSQNRVQTLIQVLLHLIVRQQGIVDI